MSLKPPYGTFPGTAVKPDTGVVQFVNVDDGDDLGDGLSLGSAKRTLQAAIDATPDGATLYVDPGFYDPTGTMTLDGHRIEATRPRSLGTEAFTVINHAFNGALFEITTSASLKGVTLWQKTGGTGNGWTGAAIHAVNGASSALGYIHIDEVTVTGDNGWERDLDLDGSAYTSGLRDVFVSNSLFFGCYNAGETIRLGKVINAYFTNCGVFPAPTGTTQGIKILGTGAGPIQFASCYVLGNFVTEAAGGVAFHGHISGDITCAASSQYNVFDGIHVGTFTNNGSNNNQARSKNNFGAPAAATTPGSCVKKIQVFNAAGVSQGFVPVYDAIS